MSNSEYFPSNAALCFNNFKEAALYFERVLPLNMGRMQGDPDVGDILVGYPESVPSAALSHLVDGIEGNTATFSHATRVIELFGNKWAKFSKEVEPYARLWFSRPDEEASAEQESHSFEDEYLKLEAAYLSDAILPNTAPIRSVFRSYAASLGFEKFCVVLPNVTSRIHTESDPSLTLSGLHLIDTQGAEWPQIIETRKDVESHRKLARLRLFIHKNYTDCSFSFIEDDISQRLYDYEASVKKHGFKTVASTLSMLLDAKALQTSVGAGLLAGLFGGTVAAFSTAAAIEIGKIAITVAEKQHDLRSWKSDHDLAYIIENKGKLS